MCFFKLTPFENLFSASYGAYNYNPMAWEVQAEGPKVQSQPQVHSDFKTRLGYCRYALSKHTHSFSVRQPQKSWKSEKTCAHTCMNICTYMITYTHTQNMGLVFMLVFLALQMLRQENCKLEASLGYITSSRLHWASKWEPVLKDNQSTHKQKNVDRWLGGWLC